MRRTSQIFNPQVPWSLQQTDGIPTRLFSTSTVAIQRSRKTCHKAASQSLLSPNCLIFLTLLTLDYSIMSCWISFNGHNFSALNGPGPEWAGCPGSVVLIDVHGNYELRCSQKCHTSRGHWECKEWCRKLWVHQGTDSSNPPHHSHSFLLEAPYQMNTENICHWWISMCWNIHPLLRILQRNTAALQSQFNVLETWHGPKAKRWIHGGLKGELLHADGCPACFEIYLNNFHVLYVAMAKTLQKMKMSLILELKPQVDYISRDPKYNRMMMQNAKHWFRVRQLKVNYVETWKIPILQDIAAAEAAPKPPQCLNTLWASLIYVFSPPKMETYFGKNWATPAEYTTDSLFLWILFATYA